MTDLRTILGDRYDDTIEKVLEAIAGDAIDYLGCGCCTSYGYNEAVKRTGHDERPYMAAHDALATVLPDLLADVWDEGYEEASDLCHDNEYGMPRQPNPNPYRQDSEWTEAGA